ncbi:MAG: hypothetical protein V4581_01145 [Bacteroidota bacterium]
MKPNAKQITTIEDILGSVTRYRETYEELYDHILSALENVPDETPFVDALYNIVEYQLGGKRGISKIERKYRKAALKEIAKKYLGYFGGYVVSPYVLVAAVLTWGLYLLITGNFLRAGWISTICLFMNLILVVARKSVIVKARKDGVYGKSSVVSIIYPYMHMFPVILYIVFMVTYLIVSMLNLPFGLDVNYIYPAIFFLNLINMLAYYRLCKDEFKALTTN